ncbi:MAG TPA: septal ring lytic transglycosylase RlpA family protein [Planctomycetota bacterium]|nr:septal ring lytic transglycosylase RlpA family protein [Planctomycetota bacterium]
MRRALLVAALLAAGCAQQRASGGGSTITEQRPSAPSRREEGMASWYGKEQHGGPTASGERFDMHALTAAHKKLRMHTRVRVTSKLDGRSVVVRINDRGPYSKGRIIDLSYAAARALGMIERGVIPVYVEVLP